MKKRAFLFVHYEEGSCQIIMCSLQGSTSYALPASGPRWSAAGIARQTHSWALWHPSDGRLWLKDSPWAFPNFLRTAPQSWALSLNLLPSCFLSTRGRSIAKSDGPLSFPRLSPPS